MLAIVLLLALLVAAWGLGPTLVKKARRAVNARAMSHKGRSPS